MSYQKNQTSPKTRIKKPSGLKLILSKLTSLPPVNKHLLIVVILLALIGLVAVFSASTPKGLAEYENPLFYPKKHLLFACVGFISMFLVSLVHYKNWERWLMPIAGVTTALIIATLIPGLGRTDYGSSRWLTFLPIQPSEFGKFACILLAASALCDVKNIFNNKFIKHFCIIAVMMFAILLQPNMSMFILLGMTCFAMLAVAGMNMRIFVFAFSCFAPFVIYKIMTTPYQHKRIIGWLDPESDPQGIGYNILQSLYAIASGGLFGAGIGNSKQKLYYLPFGHTDFIFAIIGEELGFLGISVLVILFLLFINIGFKIALRCEDQFGRLLAFGITFIIGGQAFINMCVASGIFPVTGVTLPLISYGGSSIIITTAMIGVLLNISRYAAKKERKQKNDKTTQQQA